MPDGGASVRQTDRQRRAPAEKGGGVGGGGWVPRLTDSNLSSALLLCIHRAERAVASAAGNGVFGPAAPSLFTFTL